MLRARREGPTRRANAIEWSLDGVFVGVGAVRVLRELFLRRYPEFGGRAWDLAAWCGVTTQGTTKVLERLHEVGLVHRYWPREEGQADRWGLNSGHPLYPELQALFRAERTAYRNVTRRTSQDRTDA